MNPLNPERSKTKGFKGGKSRAERLWLEEAPWRGGGRLCRPLLRVDAEGSLRGDLEQGVSGSWKLAHAAPWWNYPTALSGTWLEWGNGWTVPPCSFLKSSALAILATAYIEWPLKKYTLRAVILSLTNQYSTKFYREPCGSGARPSLSWALERGWNKAQAQLGEGFSAVPSRPRLCVLWKAGLMLLSGPRGPGAYLPLLSSQPGRIPSLYLLTLPIFSNEPSRGEVSEKRNCASVRLVLKQPGLSWQRRERKWFAFFCERAPAWLFRTCFYLNAVF